MDDPELDAIRQRRMAELMAKSGGGQGGMPNPEEAEQQEEARRAAEEQRRTMLHAVLQPDARERLARIALVKPEKARNVENMILTAAKRGALPSKASGRAANHLPHSADNRLSADEEDDQLLRPKVFAQVSEDQLKGMLEQISEREAASNRITIQRRRPTFEDDF